MIHRFERDRYAQKDFCFNDKTGQLICNIVSDKYVIDSKESYIDYLINTNQMKQDDKVIFNHREDIDSYTAPFKVYIDIHS